MFQGLDCCNRSQRGPDGGLDKPPLCDTDSETLTVEEGNIVQRNEKMHATIVDPKHATELRKENEAQVTTRPPQYHCITTVSTGTAKQRRHTNSLKSVST